MLNRYLLLASFLSVAAIASPQEPVDYEAIRRANPVPTDEEIQVELRRLQPTLDRAREANQAKPTLIPDIRMPARSVPNIKAPARAVPEGPRRSDLLSSKVIRERRENQPPLDITKLLAASKAASGVHPSGALADSELYLFLSLSVPDHKLRELIELAAEWGVTVVFRGPLDDLDMSGYRLMERLKNLNPAAAGEILIHPPLFTRFSIDKVPAYVLAKTPESLREDASGCAPAGAFTRLDGDVSPEYALRRMGERAEPQLSKIATKRLGR